MTETGLTTSQAARRLGLSAERVRQLSDKGTLRCRRTPLGRLYDPAELALFAARRTERGRSVEAAQP
jgi:excisionase family DNA binding protein